MNEFFKTVCCTVDDDRCMLSECRKCDVSAVDFDKELGVDDRNGDEFVSYKQ